MTDAQTLIETIRRNDRMSENELLSLRRAFGADLTLSQAEADTLFELNTVSEKPDGWTPYFISLLAAFVDDRQHPQNYVSEDSANWLIEKISEDGVVESETELKLLLNVLKTASHVPDRFKKFALDQVCLAVINCRGVVYSRTLTPNVIGEAEVDLLRRILYAGSGKGGIGITRVEAETLFALNDATSGRDNHPSWQTLFVQAITNYLMTIGVPAKPTPTEALERQRWLAGETEKDRWAYFRSFKSLFEQLTAPDTSSRAAILDNAAVISAEAIDLSEAEWLIERIVADGQTDPNEKALLRFIKDECPNIDEALQSYLTA